MALEKSRSSSQVSEFHPSTWTTLNWHTHTYIYEMHTYVHRVVLVFLRLKKKGGGKGKERKMPYLEFTLPNNILT